MRERETRAVWVGDDVWDLVKRKAHEDRVTVRTFLERAVAVYVARHPVAPVDAGLEAALARSEGPLDRKYPPLSKPRPVQWTEIELEARRAAGLPELQYEPESGG